MQEGQVVGQSQVKGGQGGLTEGQQVAGGGDGPHIAVLGLLVAPQVDLPLESSAAEITGEGFVARVLPGVGDQVAALTERLPAHDTLVRLLSCRNINCN